MGTVAAVTNEEIYENLAGLPVFSPVMKRLGKLQADPNSTHRDFAELIRTDVGLTVALLKLANSAYFGLRRAVGTVEQAVSLLGRQKMTEVVITASFARVIPSEIPGYGIRAEEFWRHNVATAVIATALAAHVGREAPDIFTAALLHDCGKLLIGPMLEARLDAAGAPQGEASYCVERDLLGMDHGLVGAVLARKWRLPYATRWATRWHHDPTSAPWFTDPGLVGIVHIAAAVAHQRGYGETDDPGDCLYIPGVAEGLGIGAADIEEVCAACSETIESLVGAYQAPA